MMHLKLLPALLLGSIGAMALLSPAMSQAAFNYRVLLKDLNPTSTPAPDVAPLTLAPAELPSAVMHQAFSYDIKPLLSGAEPSDVVSWRIEQGTLPTGLTLSADGVLEGTVEQADPLGMDFTVVASSNGRSASQTFTLVPSDPHWGKVVSLLKFDGSWLDAKTGVSWTPYGAAALGAGSAFNGGDGDFTRPGSALVGPRINLQGDFTVEGWFYNTGAGGHLINMGGISALNWQPLSIHYNWPTAGQLNWISSSNNAGSNISNTNGCTQPCVGFTAFGAPQLNAWNHFAVVRSGAQYFLYLNGVRTVIRNSALEPFKSNYATTIGNYPTSSQYNFESGTATGRFDDFRITVGVARYTGASFPVPAFGFAAR